MLCQSSMKTALDGFKSGVRKVATTTVIQAVLADEVGIYIHAVKLLLSVHVQVKIFPQGTNEEEEELSAKHFPALCKVR